jgi:hypothetical protein
MSPSLALKSPSRKTLAGLQADGAMVEFEFRGGGVAEGGEEGLGFLEGEEGSWRDTMRVRGGSYLLDVTVDDAPGVEVGECVGHLGRDAHARGPGERCRVPAL